jgi:hypothetical protein
MVIEGKIASILNERDLVINRGADDGVAEGMRFKVNEPEVRITDPDTGAELGTLEREKIRVKVIEVHPRFSIAKTYETYESYEPSEVSRLLSMTSRTTVRRVRKLRFGSGVSTGEPIDQAGSSVKIGDPAIEIREESALD